MLDIGCGLGDTTLQLAELVGPRGSALGVDIAPRFIEARRGGRDASSASRTRASRSPTSRPRRSPTRSTTRSRASGRCSSPARSRPCATSTTRSSPAAASARSSGAGARTTSGCTARSRSCKPLVEIPEETDEARCGPGPFSLANADTASTIHQAAGFVDVAFHRRDLPLKIGNTLDEAIEFNLALGPAAEAVRLAGDEGDAMRPKLAALLREALADLVTPDRRFRRLLRLDRDRAQGRLTARYPRARKPKQAEELRWKSTSPSWAEGLGATPQRFAPPSWARRSRASRRSPSWAARASASGASRPRPGCRPRTSCTRPTTISRSSASASTTRSSTSPPPTSGRQASSSR